jgi:hypothetical protein
MSQSREPGPHASAVSATWVDDERQHVYGTSWPDDPPGPFPRQDYRAASWLGDWGQRRDAIGVEREIRDENVGSNRPSYAGVGPRNYRRPDERIREDVCDRLTTTPLVDASDIDVRVESGEVTLEGMVSTRNEKRVAEAIAERVRGVYDVHNRIRVRVPVSVGETPRPFYRR